MKTKSRSLLLCAVCSTFVFGSPAMAAKKAPVKEPKQEESSIETTKHYEDWKGPAERSEASLAALGGLAIVDGNAGFALMGSLSKKIDHAGFIPDITNDVSIELQAGPVLSTNNLIAFTARLLWAFHKDQTWTLFATGGLGGNTFISGPSRIEMFPHFGIGAIYSVAANLAVRAEISHEFIIAGVMFPM